MSGTTKVTVGDRGRIVIPAEVGQRIGLRPGTVLSLIETEGGMVLMTRRQLRDRACAPSSRGWTWWTSCWPNGGPRPRPRTRLESAVAARLCLALAERTGAEAWTADRAWAKDRRARLIR